MAGITKLDIAMLRGGFPERCGFCEKVTPPENLEPEEAGQWVCWYCLRNWAHEDDNIIEFAFWDRAIKELECRRTP
jgi:hypothetical protein